MLKANFTDKYKDFPNSFTENNTFSDKIHLACPSFFLFSNKMNKVILYRKFSIYLKADYLTHFGTSPMTCSLAKCLSQSHFQWWQQDIGKIPQKYHHILVDTKLEQCFALIGVEVIFLVYNRSPISTLQKVPWKHQVYCAFWNNLVR